MCVRDQGHSLYLFAVKVNAASVCGQGHSCVSFSRTRCNMASRFSDKVTRGVGSRPRSLACLVSRTRPNIRCRVSPTKSIVVSLVADEVIRRVSCCGSFLAGSEKP